MYSNRQASIARWVGERAGAPSRGAPAAGSADPTSRVGAQDPPHAHDGAQISYQIPAKGRDAAGGMVWLALNPHHDNAHRDGLSVSHLGDPAAAPTTHHRAHSRSNGMHAAHEDGQSRSGIPPDADVSVDQSADAVAVPSLQASGFDRPTTHSDLQHAPQPTRSRTRSSFNKSRLSLAGPRGSGYTPSGGDFATPPTHAVAGGAEPMQGVGSETPQGSVGRFADAATPDMVGRDHPAGLSSDDDDGGGDGVMGGDDDGAGSPLEAAAAGAAAASTSPVCPPGVVCEK